MILGVLCLDVRCSPTTSISTHHPVAADHRPTSLRALDVHGDAAIMRQYSSVLECLLRLRQACCAAELVPKERLERARKILELLDPGSSGAPPPKLSEEEAKELMSKLAGELELHCFVRALLWCTTIKTTSLSQQAETGESSRDCNLELCVFWACFVVRRGPGGGVGVRRVPRSGAHTSTHVASSRLRHLPF